MFVGCVLSFTGATHPPCLARLPCVCYVLASLPSFVWLIQFFGFSPLASRLPTGLTLGTDDSLRLSVLRGRALRHLQAAVPALWPSKRPRAPCPPLECTDLLAGSLLALAADQEGATLYLAHNSAAGCQLLRTCSPLAEQPPHHVYALHHIPDDPMCQLAVATSVRNPEAE